MTPSTLPDACAALVQRGDPDRFLAAMAAPPSARGALFTLFAFNLEIARAPWVTKEPLIARMRLQFWRDVVEGEDSRAHEVAGPLADLIHERNLSRGALLSMIDARETEVGTQAPFATEAALWDYLSGSAGALMAVSVQALGGPADHAGAGDIGVAQGLAAYLRAVPALEQAGKHPLPDGRAQAIAVLAAEGMRRLDSGRAAMRGVAGRAALLSAWQTRALLTQAAREPARVAEGTLGQSEFARRWGLLRASFRGI